MANKGALTLASTYALPSGAVAYGVCASPDSKNLYVVSSVNSPAPAGIIQLAVAADGSLSQIGSNALLAGTNNGPRRATVSPDGKNLYVAVYGYGKLHIFTRSTTDGSLTAPVPAIGSLGTPAFVVVSPDNAHVYLADYSSGNASGKLLVYSRNQSTGALTQIQSVPLVGAYGIAITGDGNAVYASATANNGTINGYTRDNNPASATYGQLTFVSSLATPSGFPNAVTITDDSAFVYVATDAGSQFLGCFVRNLSTNELAPTNPPYPPSNSDNNNGNFDITMSRDAGNTSIYTALSDAQKIAQYDRNPATGVVTAKMPGSVTTSNNTGAPQGSKGPYGVVVLPNNKFLYSANHVAATVDVFSIDQGVTTTPVYQDFVGSFDVLARVLSDFSGSFDVQGLGSVSADFVGAFDVRASVQRDFVGSFDVLTKVSRDLSGAFDIQQLVSAAFIGAFDVNGSGAAVIDVSKISPSRVVVFEGSGSRVTVFEGSGPRVRFNQMSAKEPTKIGEKWVCDRDPDEESHYAADITQELADRNTTALSVTLVLVGVMQLEDPQIQVVTINNVQRTYVVAFLGGVQGDPPADWKWVARVRCANGERFDKTTWFNKVDP